MSGPILALVAITGGAPERASLEALALARRKNHAYLFF